MPRSVQTGRDYIFADTDSGDSDGGSMPTYHFLPTDPELAYRILKNEVGGTTAKTALQDTQVLKKEVMGPEGGFTIKDHIGDGPTSGYMVSLNKSTERAYPDMDFTADDIAQYQQQHASELSQPDCYFGAWHDPETHKVYLDVSKCFQDYQEAMNAAKAADQLAIFDLGSFDTIYTSRKVRRQYFPANSDPNAVYRKIWGL